MRSDDVIAIQQLNARYAHAIDSADAVAWARCFTQCGAFVSASGRRIVGTDALIEFAHDSAAAASGSGRRHWLTNLLVDGDGDRATGRSYGTLIETAGGEPVIRASFVYDDELIVEDDTWKLARRSVLDA